MNSFAFIRKSTANLDGLEHKSLTEEVSKLMSEGYVVVNQLDRDLHIGDIVIEKAENE